MFKGCFYANVQICWKFLAVFYNLPAHDDALILLRSDLHPDVFYLPFYRMFSPVSPIRNPRMVCAAADVAIRMVCKEANIERE